MDDDDDRKHDHGYKGPRGGEKGNWSCPGCRNVNFSHRDVCNRCHEAKPVSSSNWVCGKCNNMNYAFRKECNRCHSLRPEFRNSFPGNNIPPVEIAAKHFVQFFIQEAQPVQSAINHLVNLNQVNPFFFMPSSGLGMGGMGMGGVSSRQHLTPGPVLGEKGNWECSQCSNINFPTRAHCNRCSKPRE